MEGPSLLRTWFPALPFERIKSEGCKAEFRIYASVLIRLKVRLSRQCTLNKLEAGTFAKVVSLRELKRSSLTLLTAKAAKTECARRYCVAVMTFQPRSRIEGNGLPHLLVSAHFQDI